MAETCIKCSKCGHWVSTWCSECIGENEQQAVEKALAKRDEEYRATLEKMANTSIQATNMAVEKAIEELRERIMQGEANFKKEGMFNQARGAAAVLNFIDTRWPKAKVKE